MAAMLPDPAQWFFITGCQRSGTTMLRLVLECHSQISCFDEMQSYSALASREHGQQIATSRLGFKIPRFAEQLDRAVLFDYGLEQVPARFYSGQPILFLIRDARDAVSSMLKLKGERSWTEDWAIPIIENKLKHDPLFAQRFERELAICRDSHSLIAYGALYWAYKNEAFLRYKHLGYPVLPIVYESLVTNPKPGLLRICDALGLEFEPSLLAHPQHAHGELYESGLTVGNTDPRRAIDDASVGQWKAVLGDDEGYVRQLAFPVAEEIASLVPLSWMH